MTVYAFFMTAVVFLIIGMMGHAMFEEYMSVRARKARKRNKLAARKAAAAQDFDDETDRAMGEAVALVEQKLGGTILS